MSFCSLHTHTHRHTYTHAYRVIFTLVRCRFQLTKCSWGPSKFCRGCSHELCSSALQPGKPRMAYVCSQQQYCIPCEDRHTSLCCVTFTYDPKIKGFPGVMVENFYVTFSDPSCSGILFDLLRIKLQTDRQTDRQTDKRQCKPYLCECH